MNVHPAFVHFPIALLILYCLIELIPLARVWPSVSWDQIRKFLLYVGTLASFAAALTGGMAEDVVGESAKTSVHEMAAYFTIFVFLISSVLSLLWRREHVMRSWIMRLLAALGFIMLFVVGALGSNIVYGAGVDPLVSLVANLFGVQ